MQRRSRRFGYGIAGCFFFLRSRELRNRLAPPYCGVQGIMRLGLDTGIPVIFGVLTVLTEEQAKARAGLTPGKHNHGTEWAQSALQMAELRITRLLGGRNTPVNNHYL